MATNYGTSSRIKIGGESFSPQKGMTLSPIDGEGLVAVPPSPNGTQPSAAMTEFQNRNRDFLFQKITPPMYGPDNSIARLTGIPANEPDFIADFHFISMMRAVDDIVRPRYQGYVAGDYNTPGAG